MQSFTQHSERDVVPYAAMPESMGLIGYGSSVVRVPLGSAFNGTLPGGVAGGALVGGNGGFESAVFLPGALNFFGRLPDSGAETGQEGRAEGGRLHVDGTNDGDAEEIGLDLHEEIVGGGATVDPQLAGEGGHG